MKKLNIKSCMLLTSIVIIFIGALIGFYELLLIKNNKSNINTPKIKINQTKSIKTYKGILEIPSLNINLGFFDMDSPDNDVEKGIMVIGKSKFPDEANSNLILASHSGICSVCYFNDLFKLKINDLAYIYYNSKKYSYKLKNIYYVDKDGSVPIYRNAKIKSLTLITCTKDNNTKQTVYIFEIIN